MWCFARSAVASQSADHRSQRPAHHRRRILRVARQWPLTSRSTAALATARTPAEAAARRIHASYVSLSPLGTHHPPRGKDTSDSVVDVVLVQVGRVPGDSAVVGIVVEDS